MAHLPLNPTKYGKKRVEDGPNFCGFLRISEL